MKEGTALTIDGTGSLEAAGLAFGIGGGNVKIGEIQGTLSNGDGVPVYRTALTLNAATAYTPIADLDTGTYVYGMNGVKTLDTDKLYLYLPEGITVNGLTTGDAPEKSFTNQSSTPITIAKNNENSGTLTEGTGGTYFTPMITFTPASGRYSAAQSVRIYCSDKNARIVYTTDRSEPILDSTTYTGAISITHTTTISAKAFAPMDHVSNIAYAGYIIDVGNSEDDDSDPAPARVTVFDYVDSGMAPMWLTGGGLQAGDQLIIDYNPSGSAFQELLKLAPNNEVIATYDIYLGANKKINDSASLTIQLGTSVQGEDYTLAHQKADQSYESFFATTDANGRLTFGPLYELSPFMLVKGKLVLDTTALDSNPNTGAGTLLDFLIFWICSIF